MYSLFLCQNLVLFFFLLLIAKFQLFYIRVSHFWPHFNPWKFLKVCLYVYSVLSAFYQIASFFYFHNFYISVYYYYPLETFIELPVIFCFSVKLFLCSSVPADAIIESVQRGMLVFFTHSFTYTCTVKPRFKTTPKLRPPHYKDHFSSDQVVVLIAEFYCIC